MRTALVAEWMWKANLDLSWSDRMRQIGRTKATMWTVLEVHRQRTELRSTCWLSETKGRLCKWVLLTLWSCSTFLRVFYKWHFGSWLHRRKVKKQNDTKRTAVFYYWWKKEKHSSCLRNFEPVKTRDHRLKQKISLLLLIKFVWQCRTYRVLSQTALLTEPVNQVLLLARSKAGPNDDDLISCHQSSCDERRTTLLEPRRMPIPCEQLAPTIKEGPSRASSVYWKRILLVFAPPP